MKRFSRDTGTSAGKQTQDLALSLPALSLSLSTLHKKKTWNVPEQRGSEPLTPQPLTKRKYLLTCYVSLKTNNYWNTVLKIKNLFSW